MSHQSIAFRSSAGDEIVFRPSVGDLSAPRQRAKTERAIAAQGRSGGLFQRLASMRVARVAASRAQEAISVSRAAGVGGGSARLAAGGAVTLAIAASIALLRIAADRPLEGIGAEVNRLVLGDDDDAARAAMAVRGQLGDHANVARVVGQEGKVNAQIQRIGSDLRRQALNLERGKSLLEEAFPANNIIDMIVLRAVAAFRAAWHGNGGEAAVDRFQYSHALATMQASKRQSRR